MRRWRTTSGTIGSAILAGLILAGAWLQAASAANEKKREPIYNEKADAKADIAAAVARAKRENKRVLLKWGGNWCGWCWKLYDVFHEDPKIAQTLRDEYELVLIDSNTNRKLADHYGVEHDKGFPYLTVLDGEGKVVKNQNTGDLEKDSEHDRPKVLAFLKEQQAPPLDAEQVFKDALKQADKQDKLIFLRLGSPSCGYCRKLDAFLYREGIEEIIARDFIAVKIDLARMKNGEQVGKRLRGSDSGGIPWFVFLNAKGEKLITSDGPGGNIGYPVTPDEIAYFKQMLTKIAKKISPEQIDTLLEALKTKPKDPAASTRPTT